MAGYLTDIEKDTLKLYAIYSPPEHPDGTIHGRRPMRRPMSESTRTAADRAAIERWESEGGRALDAEEESRGPWPGPLPRSAVGASAVEQIESAGREDGRGSQGVEAR